MKLQKKGFIMDGPWAIGVALVFVLFIIGILLYAFALAGAQMTSVTTDATAKGVVGNTTAGASQLASFSPVLWIMVGVGLLIIIVFAAILGVVAAKKEP